MHKAALIVIDLQNDYFVDGAFPLWNVQQILENTLVLIHRAKQADIPIIYVQHLVAGAGAKAPFFNAGTRGADIHPDILAAAPDAPIIVKHFADAFWETSLQIMLEGMGVEELFICGMMTQNCVTHTAISPFAAAYQVTIIEDCCTSVSQMIHAIALRAVAPRLRITSSADLF